MFRKLKEERPFVIILLIICVAGFIAITELTLSAFFQSLRSVFVDIVVSLMAVQYFIDHNKKAEEGQNVDKFFRKLCGQHSDIRTKLMSKLESSCSPENKNNYLHKVSTDLVKEIDLIEKSYSKVLSPEAINIVHQYKSIMSNVIKKGKDESRLTSSLNKANSLLSKLIKDNCTPEVGDELIEKKVWKTDEINRLASLVLQLKGTRNHSEVAGVSKNQIIEARKVSVSVIDSDDLQ